MAESSDVVEVSITRAEDIEKSSAGIVRRWRAELALADQREEKWRKEVKEIYKLYDGEDPKVNSFPILWSNTETLAPATYNSTPEPDVRRRFRDPDPTGKVASTVLERSLSYQVDDYDFDEEIGDCVHDMLLPGRGVARIVYEPHFVTVSPDGVAPSDPAGSYQAPEEPEDAESVPDESQPYEKIVGQDARCAHVQWDDFRYGPGKRWPQVPWVSFRHEFTQEMCEEKFGPEIAKALTYSQGADSEVVKDKQTKEIFKVCEVQEIWDRDTRRVLFIAPTYKDQPCAVIQDPMKLREFFPMPRPLRAIKNSRSLVPTPPYRMYKQQALELDRVSARINIILNHLKVRGAYSAHIPEAGKLLDAGDGDMIAIENPAVIAESGGLEKLLWIMPVEKIAQVLQYLYESRNEIKQVIYEITGIADILRGSTDPNETLGAQQLKSQWGSLRIKNLQKEVQRFIRDLLRLKAEVIAEQFTIEQLQAMTGIQLPDQQAKAAAQQAVQQAQMAQQPPPPEAEKALATPSWEDVKALLSSDQMRQYRVDIETDSTVADTINQDMQGFSEAVQGVGQVIAGSRDAVASGMLPIEAVKEICLAFSRKARMGSALEDALEQVKAPAPQAAEQAPPDHSLEIAQLDAQNKQAISQAQEQSRQAIAQAQEQSRQAIAHMQEQSKVQIAQLQQQAETERSQLTEQIKTGRESQKAELDAAVKVIVAEITATKAVEATTAKNAQREFAEDVT